MKKIIFKKAFTLAEMLTSLTIIGFLAGFFLSRFNNIAPRENIMNYKKTYFTIQDAVSRLVSDTAAFPSPTRGFMIRGIRQADGTYNIIGGEVNPTLNRSSNYFCTELVRTLNTTGDLSTACTNDGIINLSNGVQLINVGGLNFARPAGANIYTNDYIDIIVDTNGRRLPNSLDASNNRDRFRIRIDFVGKVTTAPTWTAENEILQAGTRAQNLNLQEFPDAT